MMVVLLVGSMYVRIGFASGLEYLLFCPLCPFCPFSIPLINHFHRIPYSLEWFSVPYFVTQV